MQYRKNIKNGDMISSLGFGCLRFAKNENDVESQIRLAIDKGVNYFDTAYTYKNSEKILGNILAKDNLRSRVFIATKLPHYLVNKYEDFDKFFYKQLERLQTNYIDYYLLHMLTSHQNFKKMIDIGLEKWIVEKKEKGEIKNIGFSFHGKQQSFIDIIDSYQWDFCMIQYNYYDEFNQAGVDGLKYVGAKGIPVMIMEPLRGGSLVQTLPEGAKELWDNAPVKRTYADWGLRWVLNHEEVLTVLSGMNTDKMINENIETANNSLPNSLTEEDMKLYRKVRTKINEQTKVNCTACGYCIPCPKGVNIPLCFASLNDSVLKSKFWAMNMYVAMVKDENASKCVKCGKCEKVCPQNIKIIEKLEETTKELECFPYKILKFSSKKIVKF